MRSQYTLWNWLFFFNLTFPLKCEVCIAEYLVTLTVAATHSQMQKSVIGTSPYCWWHLMNLCRKTKVTYLRKNKKVIANTGSFFLNAFLVSVFPLWSSLALLWVASQCSREVTKKVLKQFIFKETQYNEKNKLTYCPRHFVQFTHGLMNSSF